MRLILTLAILCCAFALCGPAFAGKERGIAGPVEARVLKVLDGDTVLADALVWPGHTVRVAIRIRGIDAPEMRGHCAQERDAARAARAGLAVLLAGGTAIISNIGGGKYYGRVLADVSTVSGEIVGEALLHQGLVRPYRGKKRDSWCR